MNTGSETCEQLEELLQHSAALLRCDHDQQIWAPLANFLLYDGCERLKELGGLARQKSAILAVQAWLNIIPNVLAGESNWLREQSVCYDRLGDVARAQGELAGAADWYKKSLEIRKQLASTDESNSSWQRDLSLSYNRLGDVAQAQGELAGAADWYKKSLEIAKQLASTDESNSQWQRDLYVSCWRVADAYERQESDEAIGYWQRAYEVLTALVAAGAFVSEKDLRILQQLKDKLGNNGQD